MRLVTVIYGPKPFRAAWIHFRSTNMLIALKNIPMKAMQMCKLHAHVKYVLRVSQKEPMRPQPAIPLNDCVDYEHLPPIYRRQTTHTQPLEQTVIYKCILQIKPVLCIPRYILKNLLI